jgi:hypothetical protein
MTSSPLEPWSLLANWPRTRVSSWRAISSVARPIDEVVAAAGTALIVVSLLDTVGSFWRNHGFIYPASLEPLARAVLLPCWPWIIVSGWMIGGTPSRRGNLRSQRQLAHRWPFRPDLSA